MVEAFFLFAYDPEREFSVPIARVFIASSDIRFFQENKVEGKTQWEWFMEWVLKWVKRECSCLLVPFESGGWEFYLNAEALAYSSHPREVLDYLPVVDLSVAPAGYIV